MRIRQLTARIIRIPFKQSFRHASATRQESENVLICCTLANGITGWGEGVPRSYVTGETPAGCMEQLAATPLGSQLADDCSSWPEVIRMCEAFAPVVDGEDPRGCRSNALRCAVELSILDAFGQLFNEPVMSVAQHFAPAKPLRGQREWIQYSAIIDSGAASLWSKALKYRLYGFRHCKVKVGAQGDNDFERLRVIRHWIGPDMDIRLDANEAWRAEAVLAKVAELRPFNISCIEQPLPHSDVEALAELRPKLGIPVMLDESLTGVVDANAAIAGRTCDLFNIRLSKCGGFVNSLRVAALAHAAGIGFQLGCHPGETSILSAAGRHWACSVGFIRYLEGSYDRHLLRRPFSKEDMTFGYAGRAPAITRPGLGLTIKNNALKECTLSQREFPIG